MVLGHENMGIVEEVGQGIDRIKPGDRVSVPFNIACGTCRNCDAGWTCACLRANPSGRPTAGYGYPMMGPYWGGQAEYLRVPWADVNLLELPDGTEHETDFTMLSDIFPTGYHGTELAQVSPGDTVAIFGAGPVGLMAAHSASLRGASQIFVVDKEADRLALAERFGATAVNFAEADATEVIMEGTDGFGVDCGIEAVGYQAHDPTGQEHPEMVLDKLVEVVRATGRLGVVGQCPVKRYNRQLRDLIIRGRAKPSIIVSHELPLDQAPKAYDQFDKRVEGWTKVLLHPAA